MFKRLTACLLIVFMVLTFVSCGKSADNTKKTDSQEQTSLPNAGTGDGKIFNTPTKITLMIGSHASYPYQENWVVWKYIREATGAEFEMQVVPNADYNTKLNLVISSGTVPDAVFLTDTKSSKQYGPSGVYVNIMENLDKLPYFTKWRKTASDSENILTTYKAFDNKIYQFPLYGTALTNNMRSWMYRKDIFDKNELKVPTNYEEMYNVCKKLKALYPDSYPFCDRGGIDKLGTVGAEWGTGLYGYYNFDTKKWLYGAIEDNFKEMILWYNKMFKEGLMPQDFLSMDVKGWQELMSAGRGFITSDYTMRIDFFNVPARQTNPQYTLDYMAPPKGGENGSNIMPKLNNTYAGYSVFNTGNKEKQDNVIKFVDWLYSDKAREITSWGKEGETYKVVNGKREFIDDGKGTTMQILYGFRTPGTNQNVDTESLLAKYTPESLKAFYDSENASQKNANPVGWLAYNESDQATVDQLTTAIETYVEEQVSKFIVGQKPISEWDAYVKQVKTLGVDKLLEVYDRSYKAALGAK